MLHRSGSCWLAAGVLAIALSGGSTSTGCSITRPTELVPGALSQIEVPRNLAGLRLELLANGSRVFLNNYRAQNGVALLPGTLGVIPAGSSTTTVTVILAGYDQAGVDDPNGEFQTNLTDISEVGATPSSPRVRRGSVQTYVSQHTLFLPMALSYACWGVSCGASGTQGDTCKANTCVPSQTDSSQLVDFDPSLVDGTQDCFSPSTCFTPATTAVLIDAARCLYEVPPGEATGRGLNVRVLYQDMTEKTISTGQVVPEVVPTSEQEILNEEPDADLVEGFSVPAPARPQQFRLAAGLCALVKNAQSPPAMATGPYHTISAVQVSTTCPAKTPLLPVCAAEQNQATVTADGGTTTDVVCDQPITLEPAPSALYLVMDDSAIMAGAYGAEGYATAMGLSLANPVFKRTYVGFEFLDHDAGDCTGASTAYTTPGKRARSLEFTPANVAQPTIAGFLGGFRPFEPGATIDGGTPPGGYAPLYLQGAMRSDVGVYKHLSDFAAGLNEPLQIGAALFFVNRQPDSTGSGDAGALVATGVDCDPALDLAGDTDAKAALEREVVTASGLGLQSYYVILNNNLSQVGTPLGYFKSVQAAVKAQGVATMQVVDATQPRSSSAQVLGAFSNIVSALGTCLYELPPGVDASAKLAFTLPIPTPFSQTAPARVPVVYNAACSASTQDTQDGWNIEGAPGGAQHVRICGTGGGQACSDLRQSVLAVSAASLSGDAGAAAPVPEVPVSVTMPCTDGGI